ncbi:MAG TPA: glycosyltransferase [Bacteroidota bacterium]|nr:glycosyltransferase [Bacteroidota bacterium]
MLEVILLTILAFTALFYYFFLARVQIGLTRLFKPHKLVRYPFISIVIAARNEESSIEECLFSVLRQHYPSERYEVIVVNDHSTDATKEKVQQLQKVYKNLKLLDVTDGIHGKIHAISLGVEETKGEIICSTDADCVASPTWILTMAHHFSEGTAMVAGPVVLEKNDESFLSTFDRLEFLGVITIAAGLIGAKRPIICNGANLAYKRDVFFLAGGFGEEAVDNDDELLMSRILKRNLGSIDFAWEPLAIVRTKPVKSLQSFLHQRMRWATKKGHYEDISILAELIVLYFFFVSLIVAFILGICWDNTLLLPTALSFLGKIILEYLTLKTGARLWRDTIPIWKFLIAELLHVPYILITAFCAQFFSLRWKGRALKQ